MEPIKSEPSPALMFSISNADTYSKGGDADDGTNLSKETRDALLDEYNFRQQYAALQKESVEATALSLCTEATHAAVYSGLQEPAIGLTQFASPELAESIEFLPPPQAEEFGSAQWHAQVVGGAGGMILPFLLTRGALKKAGLSFVAREQAAVTTGRLARVSQSAGIADSACSGFVYDFLTKPVDVDSGNFWLERTNNGVTGALTFGVMGASSQGLRANSRDLVKGLRSSSERMSYNASLGAVSGIPAGLVNAETAALLHEGRLATNQERVEGTYGMFVAGGALGAMHFTGESKTSSSAEMVLLERFPARGDVADALARLSGRKPLQTEIETDSRASTLESIPADHAIDMVLSNQTRPASQTAELLIQDRVEKVVAPRAIDPHESLSMRELFESNDPRANELLEAYYPKLEKAFPLEGEIEEVETYRGYLNDKADAWDMVLLRDAEQEIVGGIQFQVFDIEGGTGSLQKVAWIEHIWVQEESRTFPNFKKLLNIASERTKSANADLVLMEFNDPDKMTVEQMSEDAESGITTQDRETLWGSIGIHVAVNAEGKIAPYGQPSMDGQPPVDYLSLGFVGSEALSGKRLPIEDYLAMTRTAHSTMPDVDLNTDPTVTGYTAGCRRNSESFFTLKPLASIAKQRRAQAKTNQINKSD